MDHFFNHDVFILVSTLLSCMIGTLGISKERTLRREYCESETFKAVCSANEVIVMETAVYGRMKLGRCVEADLGYLGCEKDVLDLADVRCSGKRECEIRIPDGEFDDTRPCYKELKTYLEASYSCRKVITPEQRLCKAANFIKVPDSPGFLASETTALTGCGSNAIPWHIVVPPGQTINFTLFDFTRTNNEVYRIVKMCNEYGFIHEKKPGKNISICQGKYRIRHLYTSKSNAVDMYFTTSENDMEEKRFLIKYQAIGCANIEPPDGTWVERKGSKMTMGCLGTKEKWTLECVDDKWTNTHKNCSNSGTVMHHDDRQDGTKSHRLSHGLSIAMIFAVAVFISVIILIVGVMCIKKDISCLGLIRANNNQNLEEYDMEKRSLPVRQSQPQYPTIRGGTHRLLQSSQISNDYAHIWEVVPPDVAPGATSQPSDYATRALLTNKGNSVMATCPEHGCPCHPPNTTEVEYTDNSIADSYGERGRYFVLERTDPSNMESGNKATIAVPKKSNSQ